MRATSMTGRSMQTPDGVTTRAPELYPERKRTLRRAMLAGAVAVSVGVGAVTSAVQTADAAVLQAPAIVCNPYHGQVVVHSGVLVSEAAGDGAYAILLYRWTSVGWQMVAATTDYAPAAFSISTWRSFSARSGIYGAYVRQISGSYTSAWRWSGTCSMG